MRPLGGKQTASQTPDDQPRLSHTRSRHKIRKPSADLKFDRTLHALGINRLRGTCLFYPVRARLLRRTCGQAANTVEKGPAALKRQQSEPHAHLKWQDIARSPSVGRSLPIWSCM